jgi:hypothetical protein
MNIYYQCCYNKDGANKLVQAINHDGSLPHPFLDSTEHYVYGYGYGGSSEVFGVWTTPFPPKKAVLVFPG